MIQKHTDGIWVVFNAWNQWKCSVNIGYMCKRTQNHKKAKGSVGNRFKHTHWALKCLTIQYAKLWRIESGRNVYTSRTGFLAIRNKNESASTLNERFCSFSILEKNRKRCDNNFFTGLILMMRHPPWHVTVFSYHFWIFLREQLKKVFRYFFTTVCILKNKICGFVGNVKADSRLTWWPYRAPFRLDNHGKNRNFRVPKISTHHNLFTL